MIKDNELNRIVTLEQLIKMNRAANVMQVRPSSFDMFFIPEPLKKAWVDYLDCKDGFDATLKFYGF